MNVKWKGSLIKGIVDYHNSAPLLMGYMILL